MNDDRPNLLVVSPECTIFSALQNLRLAEKDPGTMSKALDMLKLAVEACVKQHKQHR